MLTLNRVRPIVLKSGKKWEEMGALPGYRARRAIPGTSEPPCFEGPAKFHWTPRGVWQYRPGIGSGCPAVVMAK